ncbi:helix-turn-helix domain-containing protein [Chloroflexota bacterium]
MEERPVLTVEEAAEYLGISRPTAYEAIHTGEIPHLRIGRRILVPRAALERLLANAGIKAES